jgi:hypothetical protein
VLTGPFVICGYLFGSGSLRINCLGFSCLLTKFRVATSLGSSASTSARDELYAATDQREIVNNFKLH